MNAIELLQNQHREVEKLFKAIEETDDASKKVSLFRELAANLVAHDGIERQIFYPECEEVMGLTERLGEALVEHGVVEFCLYEADEAIDRSEFEFKVKVLKELVQHHVGEEEKEFFPEVRKAFDEEKLESLGEELEDAFKEMKAEDYHEPLFTNLRQVLAGVLEPVPGEELGDGKPNKPKRSPARNHV